MHLCEALDPDCWGALHFIDAVGNPIERTLVVARGYMDSPPAGGKKKPCLIFQGSPKKCFLPTGEIKLTAQMLRLYDHCNWVGASLTISAGPKNMKGRKTMGMVVKMAGLPKGKGSSKPEVTPDKPKTWANAKAAYLRDGDLDAVLKTATMSKENIALLVAECKA